MKPEWSFACFGNYIGMNMKIFKKGFVFFVFHKNLAYRVYQNSKLSVLGHLSPLRTPPLIFLGRGAFQVLHVNAVSVCLQASVHLGGGFELHLTVRTSSFPKISFSFEFFYVLWHFFDTDDGELKQPVKTPLNEHLSNSQ